MKNKHLLQTAVGKLARLFPSRFTGITSVEIRDWENERGLIHLFEKFIGNCESDMLDLLYAHHVNSIFESESGISGVGMVAAGLEARCRALIQAVDEFTIQKGLKA